MARFGLAVRNLACVVAVACLLLTIAPSALAQDGITSTTSPPIPGVGHDYLHAFSDTINPANGSLSVRILAPTLPARGDFDGPSYLFQYDSTLVHVLQPNISLAGSGLSSVYQLSQVNWTWPSIPSIGGKQFTLSYNPNPPSAPTFSCTFLTDYGWGDLTGGVHSLGIGFQLASENTGCSYFGVSLPSEGGDDQFRAYIDANQGVHVTDTHGNVFNNEDTNGNFPTWRPNASSTSGNCVTFSSVSGCFTFASTTNPWNFALNAVLQGASLGVCTSGFMSATASGSLNQIVKSITLPNNQQYQFTYEPVYGLLNKVIYPSGATVTYTWGVNAQSEGVGFGQSVNNGGVGNLKCQYRYDSFAITKRVISFDGVTPAQEEDFNYSTTWNTASPSIAQWTSKQTTVTTHDLLRAGQPSFKTVYNYTPIIAPTQPGAPTFFNGQIPVESSVVYYDFNGNKLRTVMKIWVTQYSMTGECEVLDNNLTSGTFYTYASGSLFVAFLHEVTDKKEYDFTQMTPGVCQPPGSSVAPARETVTAYQSFPATPIFPTFSTMSDRPSSVKVYDHGAPIAETDYAYDNYGTGGITPPTAYNHDDTNYPASYTNRGNVTTKTVKCFIGSTACANSVTTYTYDLTGQVLSVTDPCGNGTCSDMTSGSNHITNYSYADNFTVLSNGANAPFTPTSTANAFLTQITDPLGHIHKFTYDYNSSELTASQDQNDINAGRAGATYIYNDTFSRPTLVTYPDGGQTQHVYNDSAPSPTLTTCQLISGTAGATCSATSPATGWKTTLATLDGMGHPVQTKLVSDPDGPTLIVKTYDGLGRVYTASNPYRTTSDSTYGITTYAYDALGRTTNVAEPDGSAAATSYSGNCTTVTDEAGHSRQSCSDAFGRLTQVFEDPGTSPHLNYETDYTYNALNNMLSATQNGSSPSNARVRSFAYDSLSRLTSAQNPESGTTAYTYDLNGNVVTKMEPEANQAGTAQTTNTYAYDALNRLLTRTDTSPANANTHYQYDGTALSGCPGPAPAAISGATNLIGRRSSMCSGSSASSFSYDPMGRTLVESRKNQGSSAINKTAGYTYNRDGSLKTLTYPSGDIVTYTVGGAGRVTQVSDSANSYVGYSSHPATYAPQGALAGMIQGNTTSFAGIVTSNIYNDRLQPILLSAGVSSGSIFSLCYDFHLHQAISSTPCSFSSYTTGDNGNVFQVINNSDTTRSAVFTYDPLNRIQQANTVNTTSTNCWSEVYTIDAWGNLTNRAGASGLGSCHTESLSSTASTKNQLSILTYDAAGDVTNDGNGNQPTYDAEKRIATDAGFTYQYDADGTRMEKSSSSSGTMYWTGPGGALTETDLTGTVNEEYIYFNGDRIARVDRPSGTVHYYFSNHLGSASVITSATGVIQGQTDYYPYGGIAYTSGSDPNHYKFTGKERDAESGLDNFGARYNASTMGRFMTPDPDQESGIDNMGNPQMWNGYAYVGNNPLNRTDPSGRLVSICDTNGENCQTVRDKDYAQAQQQDQYNHAASLDQLKKDEGELSNITDSNGNVVGTVMYTPDPGTYPTEGIQPQDGQIIGGLVVGWGVGKVFGVLGGVVAGWFGRGAEAAGTTAGEAAGQLGARASGTITRIIQTAAGPVRVEADVVAEGETAVIKNVLVYPDESVSNLQPGYTEMRQGFDGILSDLKAQGFTAVRVEADRSIGSGVAKGVGRQVNLTIKLK